MIRSFPSSIALILFAISPVWAQDRIKSMPGYEQYQSMRRSIPGSVKLGSQLVTWADDGLSFEFRQDNKRFRFDIATNTASPVTNSTTQSSTAPANGRGRRGGVGAPERGRQFTSATSPDKKLKATYTNRNLFLSDADGKNSSPIATDGDVKRRIKNGTASWVYGEELYQPTAMWWSPDSTKLAYYRFDESKVPDFYLQMEQTTPRSVSDVEAYPLPGDPNPVVDLFVYDVKLHKTTRIDVRDGHPFDNEVLGHYVYHVSWAADSSALLFLRANRRQNIVEFTAADPGSGKCRSLVHEEWPASWVVTVPEMQFLKDGKRLVWASDRTGYRNLYLYNLEGNLIAPLTKNDFDEASIVTVDEAHNALFYMSHDGDNPIKLQLHRVNLDGNSDTRLTDPAFNHTVQVSPGGSHFTDIAQTHDTPPVTRLCDNSGKVLAEVASSDTSKFDELHLKKTELFSFKSADGQTDLHGQLQFPSNFDPAKKYPMLVTIYAGPDTNAAKETFSLPSPLTEYGFLVASFDSRSAAGFGKRMTDVLYEHLGQPEIDDQAAGVKSLWSRPYVDKMRVGIFGTSYGGYASAMCLLRYPDVFSAACSSSPVTNWHDYDSIYTERYMWIPGENTKGYAASSLINFAGKLKGRLMLYYGTADNNVHPNNMMQFVAALQSANKSFDLQVGPDRGHSAINQDRMMEFFIENLVIHPQSISATVAPAN
jgi:dipeptidyl-peptidase-4